MLVKVRIFLLLFFFSVLSFSQNTEIKTLSGEVVNNDIEKSGIVIINKSTGGTTITDKEGFFRIGVRLKDSLFFRSVQIKAHFVYINEEVYNSDSIRVFLDVKVNELKNVDVTPYNLSGNLLADANKVTRRKYLILMMLIFQVLKVKDRRR